MKLTGIRIKSFKGLKDVEIENIEALNAFVGKNNSGKSSILHAIDLAGSTIRWKEQGFIHFKQKLNVRDLFPDLESFEIALKFDTGQTLNIKAKADGTPEITNSVFNFEPGRFNSILLTPDPGHRLNERHQISPENILRKIEERNFISINSLDILYTIKYYSKRGLEGLTEKDYVSLLNEIKNFFPDLDRIQSDRDPKDLSTIVYEEYGNKIDLLYSGTGLKHFIDILVKVALSKANIDLIDEPEMGLHPELQKVFVDYLARLANEKSIQIIVATHSPVFLSFLDKVNLYKVSNKKGERNVINIPKESCHILLSDFGIKPSDIFNQDICLMVEGQTEVIFFQHIIRKLYSEEFEKIGIGVIQYGGGAAEGIINGAIDVSNIVPTEKYVFWVHDRDAKPSESPSTSATKFQNAILKSQMRCHILEQREIEWYFPESVHEKAQQGDADKIDATLKIYTGDQGDKYRNAGQSNDVCIPRGKYLRKLLEENLTNRDELNEEIKKIIEEIILPWKDEILGS